MKCNLDILKRKGDRLSLPDVMEVFGSSRSTIYRYEKFCIDGFPKSATLAGQKSWPKTAIQAYIDAQDKKASDYVRIMSRGR